MKQSSHVPPVCDDAVDVSIILNVHRERGYFSRTMHSIDAAVRYAKHAGISCELIVIADRSDAATLSWFRHRTNEGYAAFLLKEVDNGSLGLSRNDGLSLARGKFVLTADADDLISVNTITASVSAALNTPGKAIYFPQYYFSFGIDPHLYELHPLSVVTSQALFAHHPYVSRFLARRRDLEGLAFADLKLSTGFAFEDWHFNLQAVAAGLDLRVAPEVTVYYRQRGNSLLREANRASVGITAHCDFLQAKPYLSLTADSQESALAPVNWEICDPERVRRRFSSNQTQIEMLLMAAQIDPGIDPLRLPHIHAFANAGGDRKPGVAWRKVCERLEGQTFEEVLLVPFLSHGGGEKYVLNVMESITRQDSHRKVLILSGQSFNNHARFQNFDNCGFFVDLYELMNTEDLSAIDVLTLRAIQTFAPHARIHIKSCPYAQRFIKRFGSVIENEMVYYRFCDAYRRAHGEWICCGDEFDFLSEMGARFKSIVCDNNWIHRGDVARLDEIKDRYVTLYNTVESDLVDKGGGARMRHRILWASRLDSQKRPELLQQIADRLAVEWPEATIDVWGSSVLDAYDIDSLKALGNVNIKGPFAGFTSLPLRQYGTFLYTTSFDGLPNVILEAMRAGLVVVAPTIGGIPEILTDKTGFPVLQNSNDEELANAYVGALLQCAGDADGVERLMDCGNMILNDRHSQLAFDRQVSNIFLQGR